MSGQLVTVDFYGDTLEACQADGKVWVSLRRVCEAIGVDYANQFRKLKSKSWATVVQNTMVAEDGKRRAITMIDLKTVPMWLAGMDERKVAPHVRPKLEKYQKECADALAAHFFGRPTPPAPTPILLHYTERVAGCRAVEAKLPPGHWCVFVESAKLLILAERVLLPAGLHLDADDLLDGSVGRHWADYRRGQPWATAPARYPYTFPAGRRAGVTVAPAAYPDSELVHFRRWLEREYVRRLFWGYLERKYPADCRKALPFVRREIPEALTFAA